MKTYRAFFSNKIFSLFCLMLIVVLLFNLVFLIKCFTLHGEKKSEPVKEVKILEIWNVDSFEAGYISKSSFLEKVAIKLYNKDKSVCFMVKNLTSEAVKDYFSKSVFPDIISYSPPIYKELENYVLAIDDMSEAKQKNVNVLKKNEKTVALSWCAGAYFLFSTQDMIDKLQFGNVALKDICFDMGYEKKYKKKLIDIDSLVWGEGSGASLALEKSGVQIVKDLSVNSSYDAYVNFTNKKSSCLLGTQRDYCRLVNRPEYEDILLAEMLLGYTDLFQYVSVLKNSNEALGFVQYLFNDEIQKMYANFGMFSTTKFAMYDDMKWIEFQKQFNKIERYEVLGG